MRRKLNTKLRQTVAVFSLLAVGTMSTAAGSDAAHRSRCFGVPRRAAQSDWRVFSPPDKSFTVELPGEMRHTNNPDPEGTDAESFLEWFVCTKSVDFYVLPLRPRSSANAFLIGVFKTSCPRTQQMFDEEVKGLVAVIGGDNKRLISNSVVQVNGLPGREFIYENGDDYGRVAIVNGGRRIYVLSYETDIPHATFSPEANRIFRTFNPT